MYRTILVGMILLSTGVSAKVNCLRPPQDINPVGSSFSKDVLVKPGRCGFRLALEPRVSGTKETRRKDVDIAVARWGKDLCVVKGHEAKCLKNVEFPITHGDKTIGYLSYTGPDIFIFSVDDQGQKDMSKPYLKVSALAEGGSIALYESGTQVGQLDMPKTVCPQNEIASARWASQGERAPSLSGVHLRTHSDCGYAFEAANFPKRSNVADASEKSVTGK